MLASIAAAGILVSAPAQPAGLERVNAQIKPAEDLYDLAQKTKFKPSSIRWFMKKNGKWARAKNEESHLKEGMWDDSVEVMASVAQAKGKFTTVVLTSASSSGDWSEFHD